MYNNIMAAGSKDHPPMLGPEDIHNGDHVFYGTLTQNQMVRDREKAYYLVPTSPLRTSSAVACNGRPICSGKFGKFTSRDGESIESYYSRFYKLMNELTRNNLQVTTMQVNVQFLQQLQPEWSRFVMVTSSSGSVLEEPEIQKLQMQAKIFKENSLNKLNALKSTTQLLERQTFSGCPLYQQAFAQLFGDGVRTFKFQLSQHMNNLETQLNAETLHEMDSKSALSVIKEQFERFINSDLLKPLDIYSRSFSSDREVRENFRDYTKMTAQTFKETIIQNMNSIEQCIVERASHEQELKITLKKLSERQLQIQQCKVQEVQSSVTSSGDETSSGIEVLPAESSSTDTPLEQVQNNDEKNVFANERQHSEKHAAECADERVALANLIANLTMDTEENKTILTTKKATHH
ncbi:hypothetical protein Tco_0067215 [Tanacetum coccineum]